MTLPLFVCTNCGFWQRYFALPGGCPVCTDFRHTPPVGGWEFVGEAELAGRVRCRWAEDPRGIVRFWTEPGLGIGPRATLIPLAGGNLLWEHAPWYSPEALDFMASRGGVRWAGASHPHAYGALPLVQARFAPTVLVQGLDLPWTCAFAVNRPWDETLELPGATLLHTGGHFAGHAVLYLRERGLLFAGDMVKLHFGEGGALTGLSTHKGFNRRIPTSHAETRRYREITRGLEVRHVYTTFDDAAVGTRELLGLWDAQLGGEPFFGEWRLGAERVPEGTKGTEETKGAYVL